MKSTILVIVALGFGFLPYTLTAQEIKETVAVAPVSVAASLQSAMNHAGKSLSLGRAREALESHLGSAIHASRRFTIVGRDALDLLLKEQELGSSGNVDMESAARAGGLTGATYVLVTTIDDFEDSIERVELTLLNRVGFKRTVRIGAVANIYHSTTGRLLESAVVRTDLASDRTEHGSVRKDAELTDQLLRQAVLETSEKVAVRLADAVFPVRVLVKRDNQISLNRGEGSGVERGQVWNVFAVGEDLFDPDTREFLGREEVRVGRVRITAINPKVSSAEILEDVGIDRGAILRPSN